MQVRDSLVVHRLRLRAGRADRIARASDAVAERHRPLKDVAQRGRGPSGAARGLGRAWLNAQNEKQNDRMAHPDSALLFAQMGGCVKKFENPGKA